MGVKEPKGSFYRSWCRLETSNITNGLLDATQFLKCSRTHVLKPCWHLHQTKEYTPKKLVTSGASLIIYQ
ncbi:hypothetical protein GDO81_008274 [Engystomops pustulosus]|uniref:Uncharacterized protein n=1 Tax=Engystomops pustulosus TaxID=76066 RepID=A0AAV7CDL0_ENGPU|nr:hypothetical protein GDO81_008274 [Engystomops pustulosus]